MNRREIKQEARTLAIIIAVLFPVVTALCAAMAGIILLAESGPSWVEPVVLGLGLSVGVAVMAAGLLKGR